MAGPHHSIWFVWASGYQTFGVKCEALTILLGQPSGVVRRDWVQQNPQKYYEPMSLNEYTPHEP